jgi:hypothetical protein
MPMQQMMMHQQQQNMMFPPQMMQLHQQGQGGQQGMHCISGSFIFPVVMSVLDCVCVFVRESIQRVDFVTHML